MVEFRIIVETIEDDVNVLSEEQEYCRWWGTVGKNFAWPVLPRQGELIIVSSGVMLTVQDIFHFMDKDNFTSVRCNNIQIHELYQLFYDDAWELDDCPKEHLQTTSDLLRKRVEKWRNSR